MLLTPLLALALLPPAMLQQPAAQPKAPPPVEDRIVRFGAVGGRPAKRRVGVAVNGKMLQMEDQPRPDGAEDDAAAGPGLNFLNIQEMAFCSENFDLVVFNGRKKALQRPALHNMLDERIKVVADARRLDAADRRKLKLAGTGDIERYLNRVEAARAEFEVARFDFQLGMTTIGRLDPLAREFQAGPFGPESLFRKTSVKLTLDDWADPLKIGLPAGVMAR